MKELSTEEKAKRYNEALKVLHKYDGANIMFSQSLKEEMFPELKESEDKRIRKEIIIYLKSILSNKKYGDKFIESWIDWLEKQGKNNMGISETTKQELEDSLHKALEKETPESCNEFLEKQGEQKPVEWSEEDETTKNNISHIIRQYDKISKRENQPCYYVGDCLLWMQNIKDRVQPKQEWSEEDENTVASIISSLSNPQLYPPTIHDIEWLKSLRPQSTWKPSEEQMDALHYVTNFDYGGHKATLVSLYEQLKKLKE